MKIYVFDIDGTICSNTLGDYVKAKPIKARIDAINILYNSGNTIIFHTARGMGSSNNDSLMAIEKWREFTLSQLENWGVKYHKLYFGKPAGDIYIDDKGEKDTLFFENYLGKDDQFKFD
jgi:hypothetical protein